MKSFFNSKLRGGALRLLTAVFVACLCLFLCLTFANTTHASAATEIKPFALYEFEDTENLGKDTSGNGFHLKTSGTIGSNLDGSDRYLSLSGAGGLYATGLTVGKDFSDYMKGSYTVRLLIKSGTKDGAQYLATTGQYNNAFTVVNNTNFEIQTGNADLGNNSQSTKLVFAQSTDSWVDLVVVGDAVNDKATVYANGVQKASLDVEILFSLDPEGGKAGCSYSFCIGMQGNTVGGAVAQRATCDYKKVEVYNCALTAENVTELYDSGTMNGKATVASGTNFITEISEFDSNEYDFNLTDKNTFSQISQKLPQTVEVVMSDTTTASAKVAWIGDESAYTLKGIILDDRYLNAGQLIYSIRCKQLVNFSYDSSLITISDVMIDDTPYTIGDEVTIKNYTLTFKATPVNDYVVVDDIKYHDVKWVPSLDNTVTISVRTGGAQVNINAGLKQYKINYCDGEHVLGIGRYTYNGNEPMEQWYKEGYVFEGWYLEEALQNKITTLPYSNPTALNLYAKYVRNDTHCLVYLDNNFNSKYGTVTGFISGGAVEIGTSLNITVSANTGYKINTVLWNNEVVTVSDANSFTFTKTATEDSVVVVTFTSENGGLVDNNETESSGCNGTIGAPLIVSVALVIGLGLALKKINKKEN